MDPRTRTELEEAAGAAGFKTLSAFLVACAQERVRGARDQSKLEAIEDRIAASFERLGGMLRTVSNGVQVNIAQVDNLARSFYACVPEPPAEEVAAVVASAKLRHARYRRAVEKDAAGIDQS